MVNSNGTNVQHQHHNGGGGNRYTPSKPSSKIGNGTAMGDCGDGLGSEAMRSKAVC